jgi:hypothetical protein
MRERFVALARVAPVIIAAIGLAATPAQAQTAAPGAAAKAPAKAGSTFKTPWGDPDLQGAWSNATTTPMQRPAKWAGKARLTPEEVAELDKETDIGTDKRPDRGTDADVGGAYNRFWWDRGYSDGRTSLIFDPPDGRIPEMTPEAQQRAAAARQLLQTNEGGRGEGTFAGPEDLALYTRCVVRAPLPRVPTGYDNNYEIVQMPGYVAIMQEQMHETRIIPLDNRPHLNKDVRQWLGDSRGHWEGDTLVVETTNFTDFKGMAYEGSTKDMRLTERFRRVDEDTIEYKFTVEDPKTWSRPWSAMIPFKNLDRHGQQLFEYACHEDNYGMYGILSGARQKEKEAAEAAKKGSR